MFSEEQWAAHDSMHNDDDHKLYSNKYCALQREAALRNSPLNMALLPAAFR
ncbi:hypothetical protein IWX63_003380 [Arthrobacter sp. CAN_A2]